MNLYELGLPSEEDFYINYVDVNGVNCRLIIPKQIGVKWTEQNKYFRSSLWDDQGNLISASFRKFTNLGESPEFEPLKEKGKMEFIRKMDGTCLIISKFRGQLIVRTRGTVDATVMDNGDEIAFLKEKYPLLFDNVLLNFEDSTFIAEWYSPRNVIVEREADEPSLWLTGIVRHKDYSYVTQEGLDEIAKNLNVPRPEVYQFNTVSDMVEAVNVWTKGEGVVIYGNGGEVLKKAKSLRYLALHRVKSSLNSENNLIELYVGEGMPSYQDFFTKIETTFDYEIAHQLRSQISKISEAAKVVKRTVGHMESFVADLKKFPTRKEQALKVISSYGGEKNNRSGMVFKILDGKPLDNNDYIKLMWQNLKGM